MNRKPFVLVARLAVALVFIYSATAKVVNSPLISANMFGDFVGPSIVARSAFAVAEGALGFWLLSGIHRRAAGFVAVFLLASFMGAIAVEMTKAHPKPCGCMGAAYVASHDSMRIRKELAFGIFMNATMLCVVAVGTLGMTNQKSKQV